MVAPIYTPIQGLLLLAGYAGFAFAITALFAGRRPASKADFLVADRALSGWASAFSVAATWVWAPALFIASREAYRRGWVGLFWFTVPNVLCLVLFAFFAERMRAVLPEGFTLSHFMRERFSKRVQALYWIELSALAACSFAVQLLAGGLVVSQLSGLPFFAVTLTLAGIALAYSAFSGLRASVATDVAQMVLILGVGAMLVPWMMRNGGGWDAVQSGLAGRSGEYASLWTGKGLETAWVFGIPVTLGLLAGPFGDQSFWQRVFSVRRDRVRWAFVGGALIFALVPLLLSLPGFLAAGRGWDTAKPELVGLDMVVELLPAWTALPFVCMLLSGLVSTLDSNLCAVSGLAAHDWSERREPSTAFPVRTARLSMVALAAAALLIANLPGMKILYLFLFYGTLRASTWLPTVFALSRDRVHEPAMFYGILAAILVGLPAFAAGNFMDRPALALAGSLLTVGLSGGMVWLGSRRRLGPVQEA